MQCTFNAISEAQPGARWQALFNLHWPAYRSWFLRSMRTHNPSFLECRRALRTYMPELMPTWEKLTELAGGGDVEARFLSLWCPPAYIAGCSQAIWQQQEETVLLRNYDYAPALLEGAFMCTHWNAQEVIAMSDCLWGALDGINGSGLALSLSFGGRQEVGVGFGIPLVLRYVLEFATTTQEAVAMLKRLPVHMTYSIAVCDRHHDTAMVFMAPDRPAEISPLRVVANHQNGVEWPKHATATHSVERQAALRDALAYGASPDSVVQTMLQAPVFQDAYAKGYGTLYTAVYSPQDLSATLLWRGEVWQQQIGNFTDGSRTIFFI